MPKIDLNPVGSGGKVDPIDDPIGAVWKFVLLAAGFAVMLAALAFGQDGANWLTNTISSATGVGGSNAGGTTIRVGP